MQHDIRVVGASRFVEYVSRFLDSSFTAKPILREDAWERLAGREIKRIDLSVASPTSFAAIADTTAHNTIGSLAHAYNGGKIRISISSDRGHGLGGKLNDLLEAIPPSLEFLGSARITTDASPDDQDRIIDFVNEHLKEKEKLGFPANNPEERYRQCQSFIDKFFNKYRSYVVTAFNTRSTS